MGDSPRTVVVHGSGGVFGWLCLSARQILPQLHTCLLHYTGHAIVPSSLRERRRALALHFSSHHSGLIFFLFQRQNYGAKTALFGFSGLPDGAIRAYTGWLLPCPIFFFLICMFKSFVRAWSEAYCMRTLLRLEDSYVCVCVRVRECVLARKRVLLRLIRIQKIAKEDANLMILPFCAL